MSKNRINAEQAFHWLQESGYPLVFPSSSLQTTWRGPGNLAPPARPGRLDDRDWYSSSDLRMQGFAARTPAEAWQIELGRQDARWAADPVSPDYRHLNAAGLSQAFRFTAEHLARLCDLNRFDVTSGQDEVLFGLRGCLVIGQGGEFRRSVELSEDVPDHYEFHCVLGVWKRSTRELAVFQGSTVPNWRFMEEQRSQGGQLANLLPTGRYIYTVGQHRAVTGAFIQQPNVIVLRSNDDLIFETSDDWERHSPADNIHPAFSDRAARFSSAGCQTIPGSWRPESGHTGEWARFRRRAGLSDDNVSGWGARYIYILLTGREARLVSSLSSVLPITRLRFGSSGVDVLALQTGLAQAGLYRDPVDGRLGQTTAWAYIQWQRSRDRGTADGIVTPATGLRLGFDLLRGQSVPV